MEYIRNLIQFRRENKIFTDRNYPQSLSFYYDNATIAQKDNKGYWDNPLDDFFGMLINQKGKRIYIASSKNNSPLTFNLPQNEENKAWYKCIDTSIFSDISFEADTYIEKDYILNPHALAIFMEK